MARQLGSFSDRNLEEFVTEDMRFSLRRLPSSASDKNPHPSITKSTNFTSPGNDKARSSREYASINGGVVQFLNGSVPWAYLLCSASIVVHVSQRGCM